MLVVHARGGHIPGARSVPWSRAAREDGRFKSRSDLEAIYHHLRTIKPVRNAVGRVEAGGAGGSGGQQE